MSDPFANLPKGQAGAIYADPPWNFTNLWGTETGPGNRAANYTTMTIGDIAALPVVDLAADDCVLFMWIVWIHMPGALDVIRRGIIYFSPLTRPGELSTFSGSNQGR